MRFLPLLPLLGLLTACGGDGLRPDGDGGVDLGDGHVLRLTSARGPGRCDLWIPRDWPDLAPDDLPGFCTFTVEVEGSPQWYALGAGDAADAPGVWQGAAVALTYPGAVNGPASNVKLVGLDQTGGVDVALRVGAEGDAGEVVLVRVRASRYKP